MKTFFLVLSTVTVVLSIASHYALSRGKLKYVYPLNVLVYSLYIVIETALAFNSPEQIGILVFLFTNVWALSMAVTGHLRLSRGIKDPPSMDT